MGSRPTIGPRHARRFWPAWTWTWPAACITTIWRNWYVPARCRRQRLTTPFAESCGSNWPWGSLSTLMSKIRTRRGPSSAQRAWSWRAVLLKNAPGPQGEVLLPLARGIKTIALIGPLADDPSDPEQRGWPPHPKSGGLSLQAALAQRLGATKLLRFKGTGILDGTDTEIAEAVSGAQRADLVILTLGESPEMSGEAASRTQLGLPGRQQELLEAVARTGKPVVLILFSGRPLTLPWAFAHVPAVLAAWFPGTEGGAALTRILCGDVNPTGRLVATWPRSVGQEPLYYNALSTGRPPGDIDLTHPP